MKLYLLPILIFLSLPWITCSRIPAYLDPEQPLEARVESLVSMLTLEEKISLLHGNSKFTVSGIERLGIKAWSLSDGPHGVRDEVKPHSWEPAGWTTDSASYFPTGTALAATWNPDLAYAFGKALGQEARARNKDVILGPGINIIRTPVCGRNFEYLSEDPYLISAMAVPYIKGVQEQDVAACLKHFALNNQEHRRDKINVEVDERTLREIYLPGYEAAVREGDVFTVMSAYNLFRGVYCAENSYLLNTLLKGEWNFSGAVISDWNGTHSTLESALAGLDVEMGTDRESYDAYYFAGPLQEAVDSGKIDAGIVDEKVRRVLGVMFRTRMFDENRSQGSFTTAEHFSLARKVAQEAIVLLKNERGVLPLDTSAITSIAVIGDNATRRHASGGGSSTIKARYEVTPLQALEKRLHGSNVTLNVSRGYEKSSQFTWDRGVIDRFDAKQASLLRSEAVRMAARSDAAIVFAGLNHDYDTEGLDRKDLKLPYEQDKLITEVVRANPNTVVVLISGSPVEMDPWVHRIPAIIQSWYAGMEAGNALADVLLGAVNPSGKLSVTFPGKLSDSPAHHLGYYPGDGTTVTYGEGIMVGYRYFDTRNVEPLFCFGHGLSYTSFSYSNLQLSSAYMVPGGEVRVRLRVQNTGKRPGAETVQLYIADPESMVERPLKELKAFDKVCLNAGEEKEIEFVLNETALHYFDVASSGWVVEPGEFHVLLGSSSRDIRLRGTFMYRSN